MGAADALKGDAQWTITAARDHVSFEKDDPWRGCWDDEQTLDAAMGALRYELAAKPARRTTRKSTR